MAGCPFSATQTLFYEENISENERLGLIYLLLVLQNLPLSFQSMKLRNMLARELFLVCAQLLLPLNSIAFTDSGI